MHLAGISVRIGSQSNQRGCTRLEGDCSQFCSCSEPHRTTHFNRFQRAAGKSLNYKYLKTGA